MPVEMIGGQVQPRGHGGSEPSCPVKPEGRCLHHEGGDVGVDGIHQGDICVAGAHRSDLAPVEDSLHQDGDRRLAVRSRDRSDGPTVPLCRQVQLAHDRDPDRVGERVTGVPRRHSRRGHDSCGTPDQRPEQAGIGGIVNLDASDSHLGNPRRCVVGLVVSHHHLMATRCQCRCHGTARHAHADDDDWPVCGSDVGRCRLSVEWNDHNEPAGSSTRSRLRKSA